MSFVKLVLLYLVFYDLKRGQYSLLKSMIYCWLLPTWTRIGLKFFSCKEYSIYYMEVCCSSLLTSITKQHKMTTITSNLASKILQSNINTRETAVGPPFTPSANSL